MNVIVKRLLIASVFVLTFPFSCFLLDSSDGDGNGPICSNVRTVNILGEELLYGECYDGSSTIIQSLCEVSSDIAGFKYESNSKCPDGEKTSCKTYAPFPFAILHEYGEILRCN